MKKRTKLRTPRRRPRWIPRGMVSTPGKLSRWARVKNWLASNKKKILGGLLGAGAAYVGYKNRDALPDINWGNVKERLSGMLPSSGTSNSETPKT